MSDIPSASAQPATVPPPPPSPVLEPVPLHPALRFGIVLCNRISAACMLFAGVLIVVLIAIFGWLVFGRYVLNDTPTWVEQAGKTIIVYITFVGGAVGVWRHTHLSIAFVREWMPHRIKTVLRYVTDLTVIAFGVVLAWQGFVLVSMNMRRLIPILRWPEAVNYAPLAIAGVLIALFAAVELWLRIAGAARTPTA